MIKNGITYKYSLDNIYFLDFFLLFYALRSSLKSVGLTVQNKSCPVDKIWHSLFWYLKPKTENSNEVILSGSLKATRLQFRRIYFEIVQIVVVCKKINSFQVVLYAILTRDGCNIRTALFIVDAGGIFEFLSRRILFMSENLSLEKAVVSTMFRLNLRLVFLRVKFFCIVLIIV